MEKIKSEIDKLTEKQASKYTKINNEKILLLGSSEQENKFYDLKKALRWDDYDKKIKEEDNKGLEIDLASKENNCKVLSEETILEYCIKNNYVLCNLDEYKGKISIEMLEVLNTYLKNNDMNIASEANLNSLYILCRFKDINNNNVEKRYKGKILPKILLLHKIDKGNKYKNNNYRVIDEQGELKTISNFIRSLYTTFTKTTNFFRAFITFFIIKLLFILLGFIVIFNSNDLGIFQNGILNKSSLTFLYFYIPLIVLIFKTIFPIMFGKGDEFNTFNIHNDKNYEKLEYSSKYLLCYLQRRYMNVKKFIPIVKLKNQIFYWSLIILFILSFLFLNRIQKLIILDKYKKIEILQKEEPIKPEKPKYYTKKMYIDVYKQQTKLTYTKEQITKLGYLK